MNVRGMTVSELVQALADFPPNQEVRLLTSMGAEPVTKENITRSAQVGYGLHVLLKPYMVSPAKTESEREQDREFGGAERCAFSDQCMHFEKAHRRPR